MKYWHSFFKCNLPYEQDLESHKSSCIYIISHWKHFTLEGAA